MGVRVRGLATITTTSDRQRVVARIARHRVPVAGETALSGAGLEQNWLRTERNKKALSRL